MMISTLMSLWLKFLKLEEMWEVHCGVLRNYCLTVGCCHHSNIRKPSLLFRHSRHTQPTSMKKGSCLHSRKLWSTMDHRMGSSTNLKASAAYCRAMISLMSANYYRRKPAHSCLVISSQFTVPLTTIANGYAFALINFYLYMLTHIY